MPVSPARRAAFEVLTAVERQAIFVDDALHSEALDRLDARDRGLATEIVFGTLRRRGELDWMIEKTARRGIQSIDPEVAAALRMGAYQLRRMRVPPHAAVSETVELVKAAGKSRAAGFANAVLRRLRQPPSDQEALRLAVPDWLYARWSKRFAAAELRGLLAACLEEPETYVRLTSRRPAGETVARLGAEGVVLEPTDVPLAYRVVSGRVAGSDETRVQDIGSQAVVPLLGLQPRMSLLDLCAAPGGKTAQAIDLLGGPRSVFACDLRPARLRILRRLAIEPPALVACDARRAPFRRTFSRVLVDAPCTGTGTFARNPDIKWRLRPGDVPNLQQRQIAILGNALDCCAPGGAVVYSTCSLEPEENDQVVEHVLAQTPGWRVEERLERIPGRDLGDGFFAARLVRTH